MVHITTPCTHGLGTTASLRVNGVLSSSTLTPTNKISSPHNYPHLSSFKYFGSITTLTNYHHQLLKNIEATPRVYIPAFHLPEPYPRYRRRCCREGRGVTSEFVLPTPPTLNTKKIKIKIGVTWLVVVQNFSAQMKTPII